MECRPGGRNMPLEAKTTFLILFITFHLVDVRLNIRRVFKGLRGIDRSAFFGQATAHP